MPYRYVDDVSIADVAFEATGKTLEELFVASGNALMNTQVKDLSVISTKKTAKFVVEADDQERLLHNFLQELIFLKDAKLLLFKDYDIKIERKKDKFKLNANLAGELIDPKKHELLVDVKAVSWHMFKVEKTMDGWMAFVILDV